MFIVSLVGEFKIIFEYCLFFLGINNVKVNVLWLFGLFCMFFGNDYKNEEFFVEIFLVDKFLYVYMEWCSEFFGVRFVILRFFRELLISWFFLRDVLSWILLIDIFVIFCVDFILLSIIFFMIRMLMDLNEVVIFVIFDDCFWKMKI